MTDYNIDKSRICNLDESGSTVNQAVKRKINKKRVIRSNKSKDCEVEVPYFNDVNRVTIVAPVFANGEAAPPLFTLPGKHTPYREIVAYNDDNNRYDLESVPNYLHNSALVTARENTARMDTNIFTSWALFFVEHVKAKTMNGKKVLFNCDGYKSHLKVKALDILKKGNVISFLFLHILMVFRNLLIHLFLVCSKHICETK